MTSRLLLILALACGGLGAEDEAATNPVEYPVAKPGGKPGIVLSPFLENGEIDVVGVAPGSVVEDPYTGRKFRVPGRPAGESSGQRTGPLEGLKPVNLKDLGEDAGPVCEPSNFRPAGAEQKPRAGRRPAPDLAALLVDYVESGQGSDPSATTAFYAQRVDRFFGARDVDREQIHADRAAYFQHYPKRRIEIVGKPDVEPVGDDRARFQLRLRYERVDREGATTRGTVTRTGMLREIGGRWVVVSVSEE